MKRPGFMAAAAGLGTAGVLAVMLPPSLRDSHAPAPETSQANAPIAGAQFTSASPLFASKDASARDLRAAHALRVVLLPDPEGAHPFGDTRPGVRATGISGVAAADDGARRSGEAARERDATSISPAAGVARRAAMVMPASVFPDDVTRIAYRFAGYGEAPGAMPFPHAGVFPTGRPVTGRRLVIPDF